MVENSTGTLGWVDYMVIVIVLAISSSIRVYYKLTGGREKTWEEYFVANRSMSIIPVTIGLMTSFMTNVSQLSDSAEMYTYGTQYSVIIFAYGMGTPIVAFCIFPIFFKLQATSVYEYLERRFGVAARLVTSLTYSLQLLLYTGVVLHAPALAIEATTNLSRATIIVAMGLVVLFYSTVGGMKAALVTDVFQSFLMFTSIFIVIGIAVGDVGGFGEIWRIAEEDGRIKFDSTSLDPTERHTWWGLLIGYSFTYMSLNGVDQIQVQRLLTLKELRSAQIAVFLSWPFEVALSIFTCFAGLAIYSKYHDCDPLTEGRIASSDQLMPLYVMDTLGGVPGLPGLFVAGLFSSGLSYISAVLNSSAAITLDDYVKPGYKKLTGSEISPDRSLFIAKGLATAFGLVCIAFAFLAQYFGGLLQMTFTILGVVGGPIMGIFILGMFSESASQFGAITGLLCGLAICTWIGFGQPRPSASTLPVSIAGCTSNDSTIELITTSTIPNVMETDETSYFYLYRISHTWYTLIGFVLTVTIGSLVSNLKRIILREEQSELDPDLFTPWLAKRIRARKLNTFPPEAIATVLTPKMMTYTFRNEISRGSEPNDAVL